MKFFSSFNTRDDDFKKIGELLPEDYFLTESLVLEGGQSSLLLPDHLGQGYLNVGQVEVVLVHFLLVFFDKSSASFEIVFFEKSQILADLLDDLIDFGRAHLRLAFVALVVRKVLGQEAPR